MKKSRGSGVMSAAAVTIRNRAGHLPRRQGRLVDAADYDAAIERALGAAR